LYGARAAAMAAGLMSLMLADHWRIATATIVLVRARS
jgi:hypothetical protein